VKIEKWDGSSQDKDKILTLLKIVFGENEYSTKEYFDWIYEKNPQGNPIIIIAKNEEDNSIVGIETIVPINLLVNGKTVKSAFSCNSAVHPDFRNKGIFGKLIDEIIKLGKEEKFYCIYGVPNKNSHHAFVNRGFSEIGKLKILGKPFKISKIFGNNFILKPLDLLIKKKNENIRIESFKENFDNKFNNLFKNKIINDKITILKNEDFLNWRYKQHPTRKYDTFQLYEKNKLLSYIVLRKTIFEKKQIIVIVDFKINENIDDDYKVVEFIFSVLNNYQDNCVGAIVTTNPKLREHQILKSVGFMNIPKILKPQPFYFITSILEPINEGMKFQEFDKWFISFGDFDVF
jgi:hypothetical protein